MQAPAAVFQFELPRTQHATSNPEEWNEHWEKLLARNLFNPRMVVTSNINRIRAQRPTINTVIEQAAFLHTMTCEIQYRIGVRAVLALNDSDLERRWIEAGVDVRRSHVLRALSEACAMARNLNDSRAACYDVLRLDHLSKEGETFISLLKEIIPEDISDVPKTPYYIPNEEWESYKAEIENQYSPDTLERGVFDDTYILRTKLIYHVAEFIFMSFLDMKLDKVRVDKSSPLPQEVRKNLKQQQTNFLKMMHGPSKAKEIRKDDVKATKDRKAQRGTSCRYPQCEKWEEPEGEKFKRCAKCYDQQKRVWSYCSKACQLKDWKPNHKAICGKPITAETAQQAFVARKPSNAPDSRQVGPPRDGFRRSPALVEHVHKLNLTPKVDLYARVFRGNGQRNFITLDNPFKPVQAIVRAARDEAMCAGNKESAALLCHYHVWLLWVQHHDEKNGCDLHLMLEQMEKEFEMKDTLKDMILEMEEVQQKDPLTRPPLLADLPEPLWQEFLNLGSLDMDRKLPFKRSTATGRGGVKNR
ncbi:hypothetical protein V5O48_016489 [Marasmius crinis-equi]|uniref:MYND-type domain-containing protein n=1 Tax=Marasmius crinis-equi TaxID=585013 RepID=A0ABR3ERK9_9AGAR